MTEPALTEADAPLDADDLMAKYKRALADLENLRKRKERDVELARTQAEEQVARVFLDLTDDFRRALEGIAGGEATKEQVLEGVSLLFEKLKHNLRQLEIEGFETEGQQFTAELMEAVAQAPSKTLAAGTVTKTLSQGFKRRGKLLRPAQVVVAVAEQEDGDGHQP